MSDSDVCMCRDCNVEEARVIEIQGLKDDKAVLVAEVDRLKAENLELETRVNKGDIDVKHLMSVLHGSSVEVDDDGFAVSDWFNEKLDKHIKYHLTEYGGEFVYREGVSKELKYGLGGKDDDNLSKVRDYVETLRLTEKNFDIYCEVINSDPDVWEDMVNSCETVERDTDGDLFEVNMCPKCDTGHSRDNVANEWCKECQQTPDEPEPESGDCDVQCAKCEIMVDYEDCVHFLRDVYYCEKCGVDEDGNVESDVCIECYKRKCECD